MNESRLIVIVNASWPASSRCPPAAINRAGMLGDDFPPELGWRGSLKRIISATTELELKLWDAVEFQMMFW